MVPYQCAGALVALIALAADRVGIRLEDAQGLNADESRRLTASFAKSIQEATGIVAVIDEKLWDEECDKASRCSAEIRARTGTKEIVFLKAYGAATRLRLIAERTDDRAAVLRTAQGDLLSHDERAMDRGLRGFVEILFPTETRLEPPAALAVQPVQEAVPSKSSTGRVVAWSAAGLGVAAALGAVALRISSNSTRSTLEHQMLPPDEVSHDESMVRATATLSNLLFGTAAVLVAGGLVHLLDD